MTVTIIKLDVAADIDRNIIPNEIYDQTINKEKDAIIRYFFKNPLLMFQFVGYNGALKLSYQLSSQKKCNCFYRFPWVTYYAAQNDVSNVVLAFSQQVQEYQYMIKYWYPSPEMSYMRYLSNIALNIIQDIGVYRYNLANNLNAGCILNTPFYKLNFDNIEDFKFYVFYIIAPIQKPNKAGLSSYHIAN